MVRLPALTLSLPGGWGVPNALVVVPGTVSKAPGHGHAKRTLRSIVKLMQSWTSTTVLDILCAVRPFHVQAAMPVRRN